MSTITFEPVAHKYFDENGLEYISVTTLLGREFPFKGREIAEKVNKMPHSKYYGMGVQRILDYWEGSSAHGNVVHNAIEDYINTGIVPDDPDIEPLVRRFMKIPFTGKLLSETLVYDTKYRIAGTIDILEDLGDMMYLYDIKTSNKISDDKLKKFSLQLEIYKRLATSFFNKPVKPVSIVWFKDYVVRRRHSKLELVRPMKCKKAVDRLLAKRLKELESV